MQRRAFFAALTGSAAALAVAPTQAQADDSTYRGWRVVWSGWREPTNQNVRFGFWMAVHPARKEQPYATTLGVVETNSFNHYVLDTSIRNKDAPANPLIDTPEKFIAAKAWARERLLKALDGL